MKKIIANLSLMFFSVLFLFLVLEFVVFRFVFPASDIAAPEYANGLIRYKADQQGVYRIKNEIEASFKINHNGWNSKYAEYQLAKNPNKYRIAMIGDSFIAGFQVDHNNSVAEKLEAKLGPQKTEVYRFGIDGAPMSHYLHMLRSEVLQYKPDMLIVTVVHNDFNESYASVDGVYRSAFSKYELKDNAVAKEVLPTGYQVPWYSWIRENSATWKFLAYRQQVQFGLLRRMILGENQDVEYHANIDVKRIEKDANNNRLITDYTFTQMKQLCDQNGIKLILLMNADYEDIYVKAKTGKASENLVLKLNTIVNEVAQQHGITLIDLHQEFTQDYAANKQMFSFINDGHWNERTHGLVADILTKTINSEFNAPVLFAKLNVKTSAK